jgi:uncharacterized protein
MRVLVTGGTGLVGRHLVARLCDRGDEVLVLSRSSFAAASLPEGTRVINGDPTSPGSWLDEIARCDGVIHLAGEPIAGHRWSTKFKRKVFDSRVMSTRLIAEAIAKSPRCVLINASAIGFYGMFEDNPTEFIEGDLPGLGFLANVCVAWEAATQPAVAAGARVAMIRVGLVLAKDGGALQQLAKPFRWFLGGRVATGRQWVSWIHVDDLVGLIMHALDRADASGPINGTAPEPLTNWGFSHILAKVLRRPCWMHVRRFALRLLMGEMSELATHGQRVIPTKAKELGYEFRYPLVEPALREALGKQGEPPALPSEPPA